MKVLSAFSDRSAWVRGGQPIERASHLRLFDAVDNNTFRRARASARG
jgi:hypothetical protein